MSPYFSTYLAVFQRARLGEMLEAEAINARKTRARASLIVNPMTGLHYETLDEDVSRPHRHAEQCLLRYGAMLSR